MEVVPITGFFKNEDGTVYVDKTVEQLIVNFDDHVNVVWRSFVFIDVDDIVEEVKIPSVEMDL